MGRIVWVGFAVLCVTLIFKKKEKVDYTHSYGINQEFRFVEGIWLHRKSRLIRFGEMPYFTSYVRNMF